MTGGGHVGRNVLRERPAKFVLVLVPPPSARMKNSTILAFMAVFGVTGIAACGGGTPPPPASAAKNSATNPSIAELEDHKVSPLAQLMRDMTAFADSTKQRLLRGEELLPYPADFKTMITAGYTPGMVDHRTFDPFAFSYLNQLDSLYKVVPAHREQAFDELIQYCTACHGQVCPGPLVRIKKLRMPMAAE